MARNAKIGWRYLSAYWEREVEAAAFVFFAFDPDTAVVSLHNMARNCQT